jgi:hypothetical protein
MVPGSNVPKYTHFDPDINSLVSGNAQGVETGVRQVQEESELT